MSEKWSCSHSDESWLTGPTYPTKAEAIAHAVVDLELGPGERFWVGRQKAPRIPKLTEDDVLGRLAERMSESEDAGEDHGDGWLSVVGDGEVKALLDSVNAVVTAWLSLHVKHQPRWFVVEEPTQEYAPEGVEP